MVKNPPAMHETQVQSLGWEDNLEKGNGNPLQYSCLGIPIDNGSWWVMAHKHCKELDTTEATSVQFCSVQLLSHVRLFATP